MKQVMEAPTLKEFTKLFAAFLTDYLEWAATDPQVFKSELEGDDALDEEYLYTYPSHNPQSGLCTNFSRWLHRHGHMTLPDFPVWHSAVTPQLSGTFTAYGLDVEYPFGEMDYDECEETGKHHKNEKRIAWIKRYLADVADAKVVEVEVDEA